MKSPSPNGAIALFVKTPGLSPIKTRLSAHIGVPNAMNFYQQAIKAIQSLMNELQKENSNLQIYFAIAEESGVNDRLWSNFPSLWQGDGSLGDRLSTVYNELLNKHDFVCLMGADSPHLTLDELRTAFQVTTRNYLEKFVLGETEDGGFYFFGGGLPVPHEDWSSVSYSCDTTASELRARLGQRAEFKLLAPSFDIDTVEDLKRYTQIEISHQQLLFEQQKLILWAKEVL